MCFRFEYLRVLAVYGMYRRVCMLAFVSKDKNSDKMEYNLIDSCLFQEFT